MNQSRRRFVTGGLALAGAAIASLPAPALAQQSYGDTRSFSQNELVTSGHQFFGTVSRGLALTIEEAVRRWGEPNGYVLGQEAAGAFVGGLRYGEGTLFTRNAGDRKVFWQGPSIGFDFGFTAMAAEGITVVPIRTGVGWRLGVNLGYLKFSPQATWNPF